MKEYKTPEDLGELTVTLDVNLVRIILTMSRGAAEDALRVLLKAQDGDIKIGKLQKEMLERYVNDYKRFYSAIATVVVDNVSLEDQEAIRVQEDVNREALAKELVNVYTDNTKDELSLSNLPKGSIIVPGNDEEN